MPSVVSRAVPGRGSSRRFPENRPGERERERDSPPRASETENSVLPSRDPESTVSRTNHFSHAITRETNSSRTTANAAPSSFHSEERDLYTQIYLRSFFTVFPSFSRISLLPFSLDKPGPPSRLYLAFLRAFISRARLYF